MPVPITLRLLLDFSVPLLGWIGFFWFVWLASKKSLSLAKHSLSVTGSTISAYSYARHARHPQSEDKVSG